MVRCVHPAFAETENHLVGVAGETNINTAVNPLRLLAAVDTHNASSQGVFFTRIASIAAENVYERLVD
jgi:hypothetical protein